MITQIIKSNSFYFFLLTDFQTSMDVFRFKLINEPPFACELRSILIHFNSTTSTVDKAVFRDFNQGIPKF